MSDYISREAAIKALCERSEPCFTKSGEPTFKGDYIGAIASIPAADVVEIPATGIGDLSDGYHTFNGLYYQRMILFAALVKQNKDRAWKSYRHEDGELCFGGGWFIVGIDTPDGSYTYHYENKDFELFDCEELPVGKHWDGHTEADVTRLLSLPAADVVEVDVKDLRVKKAIQTLCEFYSTAKKSDYVQKPLAWALYQTWKSFDKMDGGVNDGRD